MASVDVYGLGVCTTLHTSGSRADELTNAVHTAWSRCLTPQGGERDGGTIIVELDDAADEHTAEPRTPDADGVTWLRSADLAKLMQALTQSVTTSAIAAQTGHLLMFHAGAVSHPNTGRTFAFVAPGGTGKTTMARRLGRRWGYLTDETVGIDLDDEAAIVAYPKPLSVRPAVFVGVKHETSPDQLELASPGTAPHLAQLALIRRDPQRTTPLVEELDVVDAILELTPESSALSRLPERPLHRLAALLDALPPTLRITYAESSDVAPLIDALLEDG